MVGLINRYVTLHSIDRLDSYDHHHYRDPTIGSITVVKCDTNSCILLSMLR